MFHIYCLFIFCQKLRYSDDVTGESSVDVSDITDDILSENLTHDVGPPLHLSLTSTLFETVVYLFDRFSSHPSLSKEAFSKNLQLWHSVLPVGSLPPTSYQEALIKPYIVPEVIFHVCVNDCVLYRGELKNCDVCPKCSESRFKEKTF